MPPCHNRRTKGGEIAVVIVITIIVMPSWFNSLSCWLLVCVCLFVCLLACIGCLSWAGARRITLIDGSRGVGCRLDSALVFLGFVPHGTSSIELPERSSKGLLQPS